VAAKVYDDLCSSQGITYGEAESANTLIGIFLAFVLPLFLARSNFVIAVNVILGLITAFCATALWTTVANTPYECFTVDGHYDDRTSGLVGTEMWFLIAAALSYIFVVVDLAVWTFLKVVDLVWARDKRRPSEG
jgi:hypothetical protein